MESRTDMSDPLVAPGASAAASASARTPPTRRRPSTSDRHQVAVARRSRRRRVAATRRTPPAPLPAATFSSSAATSFFSARSSASSPVAAPPRRPPRRPPPSPSPPARGRGGFNGAASFRGSLRRQMAALTAARPASRDTGRGAGPGASVAIRKPRRVRREIQNPRFGSRDESRRRFERRSSPSIACTVSREDAARLARRVRRLRPSRRSRATRAWRRRAPSGALGRLVVGADDDGSRILRAERDLCRVRRSPARVALRLRRRRDVDDRAEARRGRHGSVRLSGPPGPAARLRRPAASPRWRPSPRTPSRARPPGSPGALLARRGQRARRRREARARRWPAGIREGVREGARASWRPGGCPGTCSARSSGRAARVPGAPRRRSSHAHGGAAPSSMLYTTTEASPRRVGRTSSAAARRPPGREDRAPARLPRGRRRVSRASSPLPTRRAAGCHGAVRRGRRSRRVEARLVPSPSTLARARERAPARRGRSRGVVAHDATVVERDRPLGGGQRLFSRAGGGADGFDGRRVHGRGAAPEPSCGIDPTSPGLDEQLPITRPVKTGPRPRKSIRLRDVRRPGGEQRRSTPRVALQGVAHVPGEARSCPHAGSAAVASRTRRAQARAPLRKVPSSLNGKCSRPRQPPLARLMSASSFDVSVLPATFPTISMMRLALDTATAGAPPAATWRGAAGMRVFASPRGHACGRSRCLRCAACPSPACTRRARSARSRRCCARRFRKLALANETRGVDDAATRCPRAGRVFVREGVEPIELNRQARAVDAHDPRTEGTRVEPLPRPDDADDDDDPPRASRARAPRARRRGVAASVSNSRRFSSARSAR